MNMNQLASKHRQQGSTGIVVAAILGTFLVLALLVVAMSYISANNRANSYEQRLKAEVENSENILAQYGQKVLEAAQVTEMQRDDVAKVIRDAMQGRYGDGGSKAVFQMISEQNPSINSAVYVKLQQLIEAGRDEFKTSQTRFIDTRRAYETDLGSFWTGMWMRIAGYPKMDLSKVKAVSTDRASEAFRTGKESAPLNLRAPKE